MNLPTARLPRLALVLFVAGFLLLVGGYLAGKDLAARDAAATVHID